VNEESRAMLVNAFIIRQKLFALSPIKCLPEYVSTTFNVGFLQFKWLIKTLQQSCDAGIYWRLIVCLISKHVASEMNLKHKTA
jgi:hypothetical protein